MAGEREVIIGHYEEYDEAGRLTRGPGWLELVRTQEIVRRHLPAGGLDVLDVGGGPGVHARWLAEDGHRVHLVDVVPGHVDDAAALAGEGLAVTAAQGDALALDAPDASFDAVLLLGPLYHLVERADRLRALEEARRVVRPGGPVFVAGISRFASLFSGLAEGFLFEPEFRAIVERDLREGQHRNPERRPHWFTTAFFHSPDDLVDEAVAAGLVVAGLFGVEGLACWLRQLADWEADPSFRDLVVDSARAVESEPSLLGLSAHLLLVARRR